MSERLAIRILLGLAIMVLSFSVAREVGELLARFGQVLALFFSAWLISFILGPPAMRLIRLGVRRPVAVLVVYFYSFGLLLFGLLLLIPIFAGQLGQLREAVNAYTTQTPVMVTWFEEQARRFGVSDADLREFYRSLVGQVQTFTGQVLQNTIGWLTGVASVMVSAVFCLIISVYLMLDGDKIAAGLVGLTPARHRAAVEAVLASINANFGGYIRGQVILSAVYGVGVAVVMAATGLEFKVISAIFAGVALVIPFVGPFISLIPALLVGLLTRPDDLWWIALVLLAMQQIVLNVVGPRVFGQTVNMHPLLVIGAALTGGAVAGIWGALFGIPVAGIIASVVKQRQFFVAFRDAPPAGAGQPATVDDQVVPLADASLPATGPTTAGPTTARPEAAAESGHGQVARPSSRPP